MDYALFVTPKVLRKENKKEMKSGRKENLEENKNIFKFNKLILYSNSFYLFLTLLYKN